MLLIGCALALSFPTHDYQIALRPEIEGKWVLESMVFNGVEDTSNETAVFRGESLTGYIDDEKVQESKFTIRAGGSSKNIDWVVRSGFSPGEKFAGIFRISNDTLQICVGNPGADRPKDFSSTKGSRLYLMTYRRSTK
jgi:uncharacterized protein (TIGR03067 family)